METLQENIITSARGIQSASLLSLVFELRPDREISVPSNTGHIVHGAFLQLLAGRDPALALTLHSPGREKPFTLSGLNGPMVPNGAKRVLQKDCIYWFRVTGFSPEATSSFVRWLDERPESIRLQGEDVQVSRVTATDHPAAGSGAFEELYRRAMDLEMEMPRHVSMRFLTPTSFRSNGRNILFPLPGLVFFALSRKWNAYAPVHLGDLVHQLVDDTVVASRYRLRTRLLEFSDYRQVGFVGETTFLISKDLPDLWVRTIHVLADFAFYAGVGYKTTMGMGQVKKVQFL